MRNPNEVNDFDFTDPFTGEVREYFDGNLTKALKLNQVEQMIERLQNYITEKENESDDNAADDHFTIS